MSAGWTDPGWLAGVHEWIRAALAAHGRSVTGAIEQPHVRPWSTVLRVPTEEGDVWFKANIPDLWHEAGIVDVLAARRPDCVPPLLAVDLDAGWMLMADGGRRLRELVEADGDIERWLDILPLYAGLQLDLAPDAEELLARGTPDLRLERLPGLFAELLDELRGALPEAEERRLRAEVEHVHVLAGELAAFGIPETIQHDDFHDGQVFLRDGRYLLLDWGDACVSHPFFTLSVTLEGVLAWGVEDVENSVDTIPFRDAYLEPFAREFGDRDLVAATAIALRLGWICRAVNGWVGDQDPQQALARLRMY